MERQKALGRSLLWLIGVFLVASGCFSGVVHGQIQTDGPVAGLYLTWQQDPTTTMTVDWHYKRRSAGGEDGERTLYYRKAGAPAWRTTKGETVAEGLLPDRVIYRAELTELHPGSSYEFRMGRDDRVFRFRTMPSTLDDTFRFAVGGDIRHRKSWMEEMNRVAMTYAPAFIIWGGDLAYANGVDEDRWIEWFDAIFNTLIDEEGFVVPVVPAIGNHEVISGSFSRHAGYRETDEWRSRIAPFFYGLLAFPGHPGYGVLDFGTYLSLVVLDSNHTNSIAGKQLDWLTGVLERRKNVRHVIPVYHVPAYPSVRKLNSSNSRRVRERWVPLFEKYGIRIAFENHDHAYKRTVPILRQKPHPNGIVYLGDGSWGVTPREVHDPQTTWYLARAEAVRAGTIVTLRNTDVHVLTVAHTGKVIDETTIVGGLHIESPQEGEVMGPDDRTVVWIDPELEGGDIVLELDGRQIYRGVTAPPDFVASGLAEPKDGMNTLTLHVTDKQGTIHRLQRNFNVRHVHLTSPESRERVFDTMIVRADVGLQLDENIVGYTIRVAPIRDGERLSWQTVREESEWTGAYGLNTLVLDDGPYDLGVFIKTDRHNTYADVRRIVIQNWSVLEDEFEPPMEMALFGSTLDRSKTSARSEGWTYATDRADRFFGDDTRIVPTNEGEQFLMWEHERLQTFHVTVFARSKKALRGIRTEVSDGGKQWREVPYTVETRGTSETGWVKLHLVGDAVEGDADHIRLVWNGLQAEDEEVQLGYARFTGRAQAALVP